MSGPKTYSHLAKNRRIPSEYEIATSALLYYPSRGFEIASPLASWFSTQQAGPEGQGFRLEDWDAFADPRATTYARYVTRAAEKEAFVDGLWRFAHEMGRDAALDPAWIDAMERVLPVLRFPLHGLQMATAYVGHLAPGGRVVCAAAFQAADEMRRITGIARRMHTLKQLKPGFGAESRHVWETDAAWQPLRALIERLLVTYDFTEALAALCLAVKPRFDRLFFEAWAEEAEARGDEVLAKVCFSWREDGVWHEAWSQALAEVLKRENPANAALLERHTAAWGEATDQALTPLRKMMLV